MKKVHVGCGRVNIPGFINVDRSNYKHVHYKRDVRDLRIFNKNSIDLIYASHVLEYFDLYEAIDTLKEWRRVLKKGGILRIAVPNFEALIKVYKKTRNIDKIIGPLYGRIVQKKKKIYHKYVYDYKKIRFLLLKSGFKVVSKYNWKKTIHLNYDDCSQAYFPHMDKNRGILVSLNVEAKK
jgi:predicted SAM-dependent methyltransferase